MSKRKAYQSLLDGTRQPSTVIKYLTERNYSYNIKHSGEIVTFTTNLVMPSNTKNKKSYQGDWWNTTADVDDEIKVKYVDSLENTGWIKVKNLTVPSENDLITSLTSTLPISAELASSLLSFVESMDDDRRDMSGFYAKVWINCLMEFFSYEPFEFESKKSLKEDTFKILNYSKKNFHKSLTDAIEKGYLIFGHTEVPEEYIHVLILLSRVHGVFYCYEFDTLKIAYITNVEPKIDYKLKKGLIYKFIKHITKTRNEYSSSLYGFYKASHLFYRYSSKFYVSDDESDEGGDYGGGKLYLNSLCDGSYSLKITWNGPVSTNPFFWLLNLYPESDYEMENKSEIECLFKVPEKELWMIALHLVNAYSYGVVSLYDIMLISGKLLGTHEFTPNNKVKTLMEMNKHEPVQNIYAMACSIVNQTMSFTLDCRAFHGIKLSPTDDLAAIWKKKPVFLNCPLTYAYMFEDWPDHYRFISSAKNRPDPKYSIDNKDFMKKKED